MGNSIPISEVREDIANAYRKEVEWQASEMLRPYKDYCSFKKVSTFTIYFLVQILFFWYNCSSTLKFDLKENSVTEIFSHQVPVDDEVIESDVVPNAIAEVLAREYIDRLVIGASANGLFSRYYPILQFSFLCT